MFSLKNILIFIAGAEFFHTLSHIMLPYFFQLPFEVNGITVTSTLNNWVIGINAAITLALLWFAGRVKS
jgi:hypothetical protein